MPKRAFDVKLACIAILSLYAPYISLIHRAYYLNLQQLAWQISHGAAQNVKNVRTGRTHDLARSRTNQEKRAKIYLYLSFLNIQLYFCIDIQNVQYMCTTSIQ
ncbi:Hypothetical_protein [Hexamita inflata]|uniref:Hypothetical_protein n=1 Tax=Hexamita inflata TaxID=28002 RepID=A0AA86QWA6_9EUKA|nr:Hypothetical protein HINF_LOCUS52963 [Hexamita inflata]